MQQESSLRQQLQTQALLEDFRLEHRQKDKHFPRVIGDILDHIHKTLFDPSLNVKSLKLQCRIRDHNISSHFRYVTGVTIKGHIEELRLEAAGFLLRERTIGIFDVAASVGYPHLQTFYRAFQRKYDCTPAEYREEHGPVRRSRPAADPPGTH
jgi:AraC-like DNA-binding protein